MGSLYDYFTIEYKGKAIKCIWFPARTLKDASNSIRGRLGHKGDLLFRFREDLTIYNGTLYAKKHAYYIAQDAVHDSSNDTKETYISPFSGKKV